MTDATPALVSVGPRSHGAPHELAPRPDWPRPHASDHFVQFYETDLFLLQALGDFVGGGLGAGADCLVIATPEHRAGLDERLRAAGLDIEAARGSGQYVALDAAETLAACTVAGQPDQARLSAVIAPYIARAAAAGCQLRVFGEMVVLLWSAGRYDDALRLEALWNELDTAHGLAVFCAYPIYCFGGPALAAQLGAVCAQHAHVIPAESYTALGDAEERLRAISQLQQKAQSLEAEIAERKLAEAALRATKDELETQVEDMRRLHEMSLRLTSTLDIGAVMREVLQAR